MISLPRVGRLMRKKSQDELEPKSCLLLGHSHTVAVRLAMEEDNKGEPWLDICTIAREKLQPEVQRKKTGFELHPGLKARINAKAYQSLVLSIGGGPHIFLGLPQSPEPFDFILPSEPDLPLQQNARILPYDSVVALIHSRNQQHWPTFKALRANFEGPIFHLDYPPPVPGKWALRHPLKFAKIFDEQGVSPLSLRYKLWRVNLASMAEILSASSVQRLEVPADMLDSDGAMAHKALYRDPVHANGKYGRAVIQQLETTLRAK